MRRYIATRVLLVPVTLALLSIVIFGVLRILPGDVAYNIMAGREGGTSFTQKQLDDIRVSLGLNRPLAVQYFSWIGGLLTLNPGKSLFDRTPIRSEMAKRLPITIELAVLTILVSVMLGIPLGILMAARQNSVADYALRIISIGGIAAPSFWTAAVLVLVLTREFHWFPPIGFVPIWKDPVANLQQLIFPALTLGYLFAALTARMTRSTMLEVLRQDYIRTAASKGLRGGTILVRHALKNALLPVITIVGNQFGLLLGGVVVMEVIFAVPGMGRGLVNGVMNRDYPIVQDFVLLLGLWVMADAIMPP